MIVVVAVVILVLTEHDDTEYKKKKCLNKSLPYNPPLQNKTVIHQHTRINSSLEGYNFKSVRYCII